MNEFNHFSFLQEQIYLGHLEKVALTLSDNLLQGPEAAAKALKSQVRELRTKQAKWPKKVVDAYRNRSQPPLGAEDITKLSQAFSSYIESINQGRERTRKNLTNDIARHKDSLTNLRRQQSQNQDTYDSVQNAWSYEIAITAPGTQEYRILNAKIQASTTTYRSQCQRLQHEENHLTDTIQRLTEELLPIRVITTQQNQKHLLCTKDSRTLGWVPHQNNYEMIVNTKLPEKDTILRQCSFEPTTKLSNLPLSIFRLIKYSETIGLSDAQLLQCILTYLKEQKPLVLEAVDEKKTSLAALIETLSFHSDTTSDRHKVLHHLKNFHRNKDESFAEALSRFDSLYSFFQTLDQPKEDLEVKMLSFKVLRTVTPYLISTKANQAFAVWLKETSLAGAEITKDAILRTIAHLETFDDLKVTSTRSLPGFLVTTSLGLPPEETTHSVGAFIAAPPPNLPPNTAPSTAPSSPFTPVSPGTKLKPGIHRPTSRTTSKTPSTSRGTTPKGQNIRPSSKSAQGHRSSSKDKHRKPNSRYQSKSPNKMNSTSRGRAPTPSTKPASRSSSQAYAAELDTLAYYTIHSKSPNFKRKQSLPTIFKRPMTPRTYSHLKKNYFFQTSGGSKFSDVFKSGRCLRCYSKNHKASACPVYTQPCSVPCRRCHYLFHPGDKCKFFDRNGSTRPNTPTQ